MAKTKVLVVEDDKSLADVLAYNLKQANYEVLIARDGIDGLRQAQLKVPELVILDLMLPGIDGLEVCRRLRSDTATQNMLIVMLTAKALELSEHEVKEHAFVLVVDGNVRVEHGGETVDAPAGTLFTFEPDERHSVSTDEGARILLFLAPWPGPGHYRGVEQGSQAAGS